MASDRIDKGALSSLEMSKNITIIYLEEYWRVRIPKTYQRPCFAKCHMLNMSNHALNRDDGAYLPEEYMHLIGR